MKKQDLLFAFFLTLCAVIAIATAPFTRAESSIPGDSNTAFETRNPGSASSRTVKKASEKDLAKTRSEQRFLLRCDGLRHPYGE